MPRAGPAALGELPRAQLSTEPLTLVQRRQPVVSIGQLRGGGFAAALFPITPPLWPAVCFAPRSKREQRDNRKMERGIHASPYPQSEALGAVMEVTIELKPLSLLLAYPFMRRWLVNGTRSDAVGAQLILTCTSTSRCVSFVVPACGASCQGGRRDVLSEHRMREIGMFGATSRVWKRRYGSASDSPPDERGGSSRHPTPRICVTNCYLPLPG